MGKQGIDVLQSDVNKAGQILAKAYGVFALHQGIWNLFGVSSLVSEIAASDLQEAKAEALGLDATGEASLRDGFNAQLPPELVAKIGPYENVGERAYLLIARLVEFGKEEVADSVKLWADIKALFGL